MRVIFDNFSNVSLLKEGTRKRFRRKSEGTRSYVVEDSTCIRDEVTFLASYDTRKIDLLTLYLVQQLINHSTVENLATVTRQNVMTN